MRNSTGLLLTAAAVAAAGVAESFALDISKALKSSPRVISTSRASLLGSSEPEGAMRKLVKPARKLARHSSGRKMVAQRADAANEAVIYSCSFDFLTEGSESEPAPLELDDWDNIPEELIGEADYGFGGQGLMQAGGAVYIPFEYNDEPDSDDPWYLEGMLWTPDFYEPMELSVELDVKIAPSSEVDKDHLWAYASDYSRSIADDNTPISTEWTRVSLGINANDFVPESDDDSYYLTLFAEGGADILIKDVVIKGKKAKLQIPVALGYSDFTGSSFTAHWSEVDGASGYYLTVYEFDPATKTNGAIVLDAIFTENTSYVVSGLTPGEFYSYQVTATDGSYTSSPSNLIVVCELLPPSGVVLKAGSDNKTLEAVWDATPGANYYVLTANSSVDVKAGQSVILADADFSGIESTGTVAVPVESDFWYETRPELPGWEFSLGCEASGAYGFWDNAGYTAMTGLTASLSSMDYDLSNIKDGKVSVNVEAASPGNGMLAGMIVFDESQSQYSVASAYGTPGDIPADYETYSFELSGAAMRTQFLFITRTEGNKDGAILIRKLQVSAEAMADGSIGIPVGTLQTAATYGSFIKDIESGVSYTAVVVPYLVSDSGYILATGQPSETVVFKPEVSGVESVDADKEGEAIYYNLQGQRIDSPAKGSVVIKINGAKVSKTVF